MPMSSNTKLMYITKISFLLQNAYRMWQLAQLGLILKLEMSRFRITTLANTN